MRLLAPQLRTCGTGGTPFIRPNYEQTQPNSVEACGDQCTVAGRKSLEWSRRLAPANEGFLMPETPPIRSRVPVAKSNRQM